jgi:hypothetical protein
MIIIEELTPYQKNLANILWSLETWEQIEFFVQGLNHAGRADAVTVIHLMTAATLDEEFNVAESQQYLSKFRLA